MSEETKPSAMGIGQEFSQASSVHDVEKTGDYAHLTNTSVQNFAWENVNVTVKDRVSGNQKTILTSCNGVVKAGEMMAIMGPSGCGKTTLLNILAHRDVAALSTEKTIMVNSHPTTLSQFRRISSFVEQEDALIGALTVKETLYFAAKLSLPSSVSKAERMQRVEGLINSFGLQRQSNVLIGTPIRKGISGGQKRRVTLASQLITSPRVVFLDEPTSGLDSHASFEVMNFVKNICKKHNILVIASIHQPSTSTFNLFDKLLLLSLGSTIYNGPISEINSFFAKQGCEIPTYTNPAEYLLQLVNTDFAADQTLAETKLKGLMDGWENSVEQKYLISEIESVKSSGGSTSKTLVEENERLSTAQKVLVPFTLVHRNFIKGYRDVIAYGIRVAMYLGLAIMMGTIWLRLGPHQDNIIPFINALFFGGAFMSFMAVAYIPAYLEDRSIYIKERANGLYGPTAFMVSNFIIGLPFLFIIAMLFSIIAYWLCGFRPTAEGFFMFVMWLFLDLVAAESLVVLITNVAPIFVVALAAVAFANGLWMSVGGFMVPPHILNVFWKYVFHYIDYQAYVFQGMMVNEFRTRTYNCDTIPGGGCYCSFKSSLNSQCEIDGKDVLEQYGYNVNKVDLWIGIMLCIILGYRILGWAVLFLRRT